MRTSMDGNPQQSQMIGQTERIISAATGGLVVGFGLIATKNARIPLFAVGGLLLARAITGRSKLYRLFNVFRSQERRSSVVRVEQTVTIDRPPEDVYVFWRKLENLPHFMHSLRSVTEQDGRSHWVAHAPLDTPTEWDAMIEEDWPAEKIAWQTLPGSVIENTGVVLFRPVLDGSATEVHVRLEYKTLGGLALETLLGEDPGAQLREDLRRLKTLLEMDRIPAEEGQPDASRA